MASPKRLTREEQKARTRDRLLGAAARVIARKGLGAASVDEISEEAGFSSGALYANFASKEEVFAAALRYQLEDHDRFLEAAGRSGSIASRLAADVEWLAGLSEWQALFWLEIVAHGGRSATLRPVVRDYLEQSRARLAQEIRTGARESGVTPPLPAKELAALVLAVEIGLFVQRLYAEDVSPPLLKRLLDELLK
jgi:AcrR family transcriptional regulator